LTLDLTSVPKDGFKFYAKLPRTRDRNKAPQKDYAAMHVWSMALEQEYKNLQSNSTYKTSQLKT